MALRIEEDLGMHYTIGVGSGEVFVGKRFEVLGGQEDGVADKVVMEKVIEACEVVIPGSEGGGRLEGGVGRGEGNVIESGKPEEEFWRKGALKMQMLLALGKSLEERVEGCVAHLGCCGREVCCGVTIMIRDAGAET